MQINKHTREEIKTRIAEILFEHEESFINDDGVDQVVCDEISEIIMKCIDEVLIEEEDANHGDLDEWIVEEDQ